MVKGQLGSIFSITSLGSYEETLELRRHLSQKIELAGSVRLVFLGRIREKLSHTRLSPFPCREALTMQGSIKEVKRSPLR